MGQRRPAARATEAGNGRPDALAKALDLLARRPHFRAELSRKLLARGYEPDEVEAAIARAAALGYLDDEALTAGYAAELAERKGLGRARVVRELARRGAPEEVVDRAVAGTDEAQELERAREAAARWSRGRGVAAAALARHLDRKGFARHVIFRVLKEFAADAGDPPAEE